MSLLELAQLVVAGRAVRDNVHAVEAQLLVHILGRPELFADLARELCVVGLDNTDAYLGQPLRLLEETGELGRQVEIEQFSSELPLFEPASFAVCSAVRQKYLWSHEEDLTVEHPNATIEQRVLEHDWHAELAQHIVREFIFVEDNLGEHLPRVSGRVELVQVVFAAVATNLQLRARPELDSLSFAHLERFDDVFFVGGE